MPESPVCVAEGKRLDERTKRVVYDQVVEGGYSNQDDHEYGFWDRTGLRVITLEEEQSAETDLLNVHPNKHMLDCLWEKQATCVGRGRLRVPVEEEVLVEEIEKEECKACKAIDNRRDNGISEG